MSYRRIDADRPDDILCTKALNLSHVPVVAAQE